MIGVRHRTSGYGSGETKESTKIGIEAHEQLRCSPADNTHPTLKPRRRGDAWLRSGRLISTNYDEISLNDPRRIFEEGSSQLEHNGWVGVRTASKSKFNTRGNLKSERWFPIFVISVNPRISNGRWYKLPRYLHAALSIYLATARFQAPGVVTPLDRNGHLKSHEQYSFNVGATLSATRFLR